MICDTTTFPTSQLSAYVKDFLQEDYLLVDIETTGLSPERSFIYCIGCGYRKGKVCHIQLYFGENQADEPQLLRAFLSLAQNFHTLLTFNGTTFDLPYLKKRIQKLGLTAFSPLSTMESLDLYREIGRMKKLFALPSYRQKDLEDFLGNTREDPFTGGELIAIYALYSGKKSVDTDSSTSLSRGKADSPTILSRRNSDDHTEDLSSKQEKELLAALLLHNREDVRGMFALLDLLAYGQLADGAFSLTEVFTEEDSPLSSSAKRGTRGISASTAGESATLSPAWLSINFKLSFSLPQALRRIGEEASFILEKDHGLVRLPINQGVLKHFFPDPENYYYLPLEDEAVHKSIGSFVDAAHRKKATRKTCYTKIESSYLKLPTKKSAGTLRKDYGDKDSYLLLPAKEEDLADFLRLYFSEILYS